MKQYRRDGDIGSLLIIMNTVRVKKSLKIPSYKSLISHIHGILLQCTS